MTRLEVTKEAIAHAESEAFQARNILTELQKSLIPDRKEESKVRKQAHLNKERGTKKPKGIEQNIRTFDIKTKLDIP